MNTVGYIFIMLAAVIIRAINKGRVENLPGDLSDFFTAIFTGDSALLKEVSGRTGKGLEASDPAAIPATQSTSGESGFADSNAFIAEAKKLGSVAKGYSWGRTGPDYYDCSGLMWRALKNLGVYKGIRFTSHTFAALSSTFASQVKNPAPGDIVLWVNHHMGVVTGTDSFYSARSLKSGIGESKISTFRGSAPIYYRLKGKVTAGEGAGGGGGSSW